MEISQAAADIIPRIKELEKLTGESLEDEMKSLKQALLQNPDAAALMFPEDVGMLVIALRRITGESIAEATKEKKEGTSKKKKMMTAEELAAAMDDLQEKPV